MPSPHRALAAIIVPAFNAQDFIVQTLDSARAAITVQIQASGCSSEDIPIVVVDDASTDDTARTVSVWTEQTGQAVRLLINPKNMGTSASRNRGAAELNADFLFFLDHDDEYFPNHLAICLSAFQKSPEFGYIRTQAALPAQVDPAWIPTISSHLPITLCVRQACHEILGGFNENPSVRVLRCEDVLYANLLEGFFKGGTLAHTTVRHHRIPGNAIDRQMQRFQNPPGVVPQTLTPAEAAAKPQVMASHNEQARAAGRRIATVQRFAKLPKSQGS